jgi:hypothetical protein
VQGSTITTPAAVATFLAWQADRRNDAEEQRKFREDALLYPDLLVFAVMRKKSPFIHLIHSAGTYPKVPGADGDWQGKSIGFLGDRTSFATPQMVELGKTTAWGWEDMLLPTDLGAMVEYYQSVEHRLAYWAPEPDTPRVRRACPRMLALIPSCVKFCAEQRRTPVELYQYTLGVMEGSTVDPAAFDLILDWCGMASQAGTGTNSSSSVLSFATPAIFGTTDHLQEWAHRRLELTLGKRPETAVQERQDRERNAASGTLQGTQPTGVDVAMLAQVTAAVVAAIRAEDKGRPADDSNNLGTTKGEDRPYSEFQLAKLKGFCCVRSTSNLPPIWEYFKTTKDVDAHRIQLMESMKEWARLKDVQINRGLYFDKATMEDIVKMEFCPGTPTAYLSTAEQGISLLVCRPRTGNETADIRSREQAIQLTSKNHTLAEALLLGKKDPRQPATNYHELKLDVGTFCAFLWTLFGEACDYFENCYALFTMLDSESVFANATYFTPLICRQITWATINDSRQYFFRTLTENQFAVGNVRWPTSLLMQIIGADVQACREIKMGNFPDKWSSQATVGTLAATGVTRGHKGQTGLAFTPPPGLPPGPSPLSSTIHANTSQVSAPERASSANWDRPVSIRQHDIHPQLKHLMARYITHFRSVQLKTLLGAANITEAELPVLPKYMSSGTNNLCYAYVLGKCQGRYCGKASRGHAPVGDITDAFAQELCRALAGGVEKRLATEPPHTPQQYSGGYGSKRYKRTM